MSEASPDIASVLAVLETRRDDLRIAQELIEVLPIPVYFKARDGKYLGVNRAWELFFGVKRAEMIGGRVADLYPNAPGVAAKHREMDEQLWANRGDQSYEIRLTLPDGRVRHTIYYKATYSGTEGEVAGLICASASTGLARRAGRSTRPRTACIASRRGASTTRASGHSST